MKIFLNGRELLVHDKTTLIDLLDRLGTDKLKTVIQLSGEIVRRENLSGKKLKEGDIIEIISIVGGG
jgi:sulfur carrier protein